MQSFAWKVCLRVALLVALACYSVTLLRTQRQLKQLAERKASFFSQYSVPFTLRDGLSAEGSLIEPPSAPGPVAVFLLHSQTLQSDIAFWRRVQQLAPSNLHLTGYCDDQQCVAALKASHAAIGFPVICYGEPTNLEALWEVDKRAEFAYFTDGGYHTHNLSWRYPSDTPLLVAKEIVP